MIKPVYPYPLFVSLTGQCNYACSYCFRGGGAARTGANYVVKHFSRLLAQAQALGVSEVRLSGGEPLLVPEAESICAEVRRHHMDYTLVSNGALLEQQLGWLSCYPPRTLWLSYHAEYTTPREYARVVGVAAKCLHTVGVHVLAKDMDDVPDLLTMAVSEGAKRIKVLYLTPTGDNRSREVTGRVWTRDRVLALAEELRGRARTLLELQIEMALLRESAHGLSTCVLRSRPLLSLDYDGRAFPCCLTVGYGPAAMGDLSRETLAAIVARTTQPMERVPCDGLLPQLMAGKETCPLRILKLTVRGGHVEEQV